MRCQCAALGADASLFSIIILTKTPPHWEWSNVVLTLSLHLDMRISSSKKDQIRDKLVHRLHLLMFNEPNGHRAIIMQQKPINTDAHIAD